MSDTPNNITKLLTALLGPAQDVENALQQLLTQRQIDTAVGAQLDTIGVIVDQPRGGLADETYRRYLRARISTNRSNGTIADMIKIVDLLVFEDDAYIRVINQGTAAFVVRVENVIITDLANDIIKFLRQGASGGVRVILETWPATRTDMFMFDGGDGKGWGDALDATTGGKFASAID